MSKFSTGRLLSRGLFQSLSKPQHATTPIPSPWARLFSHSARKSADPDSTGGNSNAANVNVMDALSRTLKSIDGGQPQGGTPVNWDMYGDGMTPVPEVPDEPYHFHIYATKRNCHVTVTKPNRDAIISLSCGNLGFRKSQRKQYDAAYQLGAYVVDKMHQTGLVKEIQKMEVILRDFGPGREAVVKVLLGNEGKYLRPKIIRVADATRLKFGGTRSPKPRRI
ncbi:hypothetical protein QBC39DRAFT_343110 [Podospora conica]|nr:hypothetical protein QBC39DRAFT_343110 [Schizothecium conicum]